jgi:SAM-dependent methyltransferase
MNEFIHGVVRAAAETFDFPGPMLELGSYVVAGQEHIGDLRGLFPGRSYMGIDMRPGPGVDSVEDVENLPRADATAGSVLALNLFEHVQRFWRGFDELQRVLRPDGLLVVSCPFHLHIHAFPNDYWRFTPEAFRLLLEGLPQKIIGYHGPRKRPLDVWALATGPDYPRISHAQHARFRDCIRRYARQPLEWDKRLRYRIGRLLCGRGPFAPYLDAEQFETELIEAA